MPGDFQIVRNISKYWRVSAAKLRQICSKYNSMNIIVLGSALSVALNELNISVQYVEQPRQNESPSVFSQARLKDRECGPQT